MTLGRALWALAVDPVNAVPAGEPIRALRACLSAVVDEPTGLDWSGSLSNARRPVGSCQQGSVSSCSRHNLFAKRGHLVRKRRVWG